MTIALGIVVAYMVGDGGEGLLDVHLDRIERHTRVPYVIHGSATRLIASSRLRLEQHPQVRLHDLPPTSLRGAEEHSGYLEPLVAHAIADGATHIAILHVDSFPVRDGWVETLVGTLSNAVAFATIEGIDTACLVFHRDFYLEHRPSFLVARETQRSAAYAAFRRSTGVQLHHSGTGFGFEAHQRHLSWHSMRATSRDRSSGAAIYDDAVFHLKGALSLTRQLEQGGRSPETSARTRPGSLGRLGSRRFERILRAARAVVPSRLREKVRARFPGSASRFIDEPRVLWHAQARDRLLADPDGFIEQLRGRG
jgi:hypothetical protein